MTRDRVIVVGGGLAGLTAAVELVDRDFDVTLIEGATQCGGKLASWRSDRGDPIEHGMHGWWPNYVNFFGLMERVGIRGDDVLRRAPGTEGVMTDGSSFAMKPVQWPSPLFLLGLVSRLPIRKPAHLLSILRAGIGILAFRVNADFANLDGSNFRDWLAERGVERRVHDLLFEPYIRGFSFDSANRTSAAAALSSLHFYLVRHAADIVPSWLVDDPDSLIIRPMVRYIEKHGRVVCSNRVTGLVQDGQGWVAGVQTTRRIPDRSGREPRRKGSLTHIRRDAVHNKDAVSIPIEHQRQLVISAKGDGLVAYEETSQGSETTESATGVGRLHVTSRRTPLSLDDTGEGVVLLAPEQSPPSDELARVPLCSVPKRGFVLEPNARQVFVGRHGSERIVALSAMCTHMNNRIAWDATEARFKCPAHQAEFDPNGEVLKPPATRALTRYNVQLEGTDVVVRADVRAPTLEAEHVILAVDVENCKRVVPDHFREHCMFRAIDALATTPVIVARLWFEGDHLLGDRTSGIFVDYPFLDNFFVLSNLQDSLRSNEQTVVEVQAYMVEAKIHLSDAELLELILEDLYRAFAPLKGRRPSEDPYILRHGDVFTHHSPGSDHSRPGTRTTVPHLHLAGDWVGRSPEVWHMERAVVSGKRAASSVIEDAGGTGPGILPLPKAGLLFRACAAAARAITRVWRWIGVADGAGVVVKEPEDGALGWSSRVAFGVYKFPGQPSAQLVTGSFGKVRGRLSVDFVGGTCRASGEFCVDLQSVDTRNNVRDQVLRTIVFGGEARNEARFKLEKALAGKGDVEKMVRGEAVTARCSGTLEMNGVCQRLEFVTRVALLKSGLASVLSTEDIVIETSRFGMDFGELQGHCGAIVAGRVQLRLRLAIPYVMR